MNGRLREFVRANLSPTELEKRLVQQLYSSIKDALGENNCLQIGSFPRFTAIRPLHDLDVLYVLGDWRDVPDNIQVLDHVHEEVSNGFVNPTEYALEFCRGDHSIGIKFLDGEEEVFAIDVVPAYTDAVNEFGQPTYMVPEASSAFGSNVGVSEEWIKTDPRGYISEATEINRMSSDYRKAVKLAKFWKSSCKSANDDFPLKSFHLEQIFAGYFRRYPHHTFFDAVFKLFCEIEQHITEPAITDRADRNRFIDQYVADLTGYQRDLVLQARDHLMIMLESIGNDTNLAEVFSAGFHRRTSGSEEYLFDQGIPVLTEDTIAISGQVQQRTGGFRAFVLDILGRIQVDRKIRFSTVAPPEHDLLKWKVKNDDDSPQPRGEITDHQTLNDLEHTKYIGRHYVECYAIKDGVCIAKARQYVQLGSD